MREFVPGESGKLLLIKILVVCLIEIADIDAILKILWGNHNISRRQINPFTRSDTNNNQQYAYNQVYIIPHKLFFKES
jgi:hypothetical protein